ncbi:hypothetical protein, partial [Amycolatopsis sp. M39]|uniref:hypothetical protein n=1 Tax=Amycolatopsis sp. M39 TaxID=1825094 RepID=UPI00350FD442
MFDRIGGYITRGVSAQAAQHILGIAAYYRSAESAWHSAVRGDDSGRPAYVGPQLAVLLGEPGGHFASHQMRGIH